MAESTRINYNAASVLGGQYVANAIHNLVAASNQLDLAVRVANEVTAQSVSKENLEGSPEFGVEVGEGTNFYNKIANLQAALTTVMGSAAIPELWQG
jgi:hypothetical protein